MAKVGLIQPRKLENVDMTGAIDNQKASAKSDVDKSEAEKKEDEAQNKKKHVVVHSFSLPLSSSSLVASSR